MLLKYAPECWKTRLSEFQISNFAQGHGSKPDCSLWSQAGHFIILLLLLLLLLLLIIKVINYKFIN